MAKGSSRWELNDHVCISDIICISDPSYLLSVTAMHAHARTHTQKAHSMELTAILMNDLFGRVKVRDIAQYPVLWLDPPSRGWMTVSLRRNQSITQFQALLLEIVWLYGLLLRLIPIQKIIPELFSHTWAAILADSSNLSPQSKFSEFMQLEWPFQFTAVTKISSICAGFVIRYICLRTSICICIHI